MTAPDLRLVLRDRLRVAMKERDAVLVTALRTVLGAIDNASAVPTEVNAGAIEASAVGIGAMDVSGRELIPDEVADIVRAEIAELREAPARDAESEADQRRVADQLEELLGD